MDEQEDNTTFRMTIDLARKDKHLPKVKFTACGNTKEEFEANLVYLKSIGLREAGY